MKYYGIYKITNKVNGKMYIGQHQTENLDDGYLGSGDVIKRAVKKYGKESFTKEWLEFAENPEDLNYLERTYVNEEWLARPDVYNISLGGDQMSLTASIVEKIREKAKGRRHTDEWKREMSKRLSGANNPFYGKRHTAATRNRLKCAALIRDNTHLCIPVSVVDLDGNVIDTMKSRQDVSLKYNVSKASVSKSLKTGAYVKGVKIIRQAK